MMMLYTSFHRITELCLSFSYQAMSDYVVGDMVKIQYYRVIRPPLSKKKKSFSVDRVGKKKSRSGGRDFFFLPYFNFLN